MSSEVGVLTPERITEIVRHAFNEAVKVARLDKAFPDVMTLCEVAEYLQVSKATIRNKIRDERLPVSSKLGNPRFLKAEIDSWLKGGI
jgi:excisionase family DNA binding protein